MSDRLINISAVKEHARQRRLLRSGGKCKVRVSKEYVDALDLYVRDTIDAHVQMNGSHGTMKADVFLSVPSRPRKGK